VLATSARASGDGRRGAVALLRALDGVVDRVGQLAHGATGGVADSSFE
jgi:hypothetical protein